MMIKTQNKELGERLKGYSTVMLLWALLRTIIGLLIVAQYALEGALPDGIYAWITVCAIIALGIYLAIAGRMGLVSYSNKEKLMPFFIMCIIGLVLSAITLITFVYWKLVGISPSYRDVFSTSVDFILYLVGVFYAWHLKTDPN